MIYECLLAPTESPTSFRDIKRALLTYDKVKLIDPNDRDVIPSNTFMAVVSGMPIVGADTGPVRPMGKELNYDNKFEQTIDLCKPAIKQGLLEVTSTYNISETKGFSIGGIPTGGYPLDTKLVFGLYRRMAANQEFLKSSIKIDKQSLINLSEKEIDFSLKGQGDIGINGKPSLPYVEDETILEHQKEFISQIARARIASFIKYAGFCEQKNLIPLFSSSVYGGIASNVLNNVQSLLKEDNDDDYWIKRNRVLELCHEEYLEDVQLDMMSVEEIIKMRSKIWGNQAKSREELFDSIGKISKDIDDYKIFAQNSGSLIAEYRKEASKLELERKNLKFKIKCDIGQAFLGGGSSLVGLLSQLQSPFASVGLTLAAGGIWALEKSKEYIPALRELKQQEEEINRGAGLGIQNFYSRIK